MDGIKFCNKCKTNKHITEFHKNNKNLDGRSTYCAKCSCGISRQWTKDNPGNYKIYLSTAPRNVLDNKKRLGEEYREAHRDELNEREKKRYAEKRQDIIPLRRAKYKLNRDEIILARRLKYNSDKEWIDAENLRRRERRSKNIELERERQRAWTRNNPEAIKGYRQHRRAVKALIPGSHTMDEWNELCEQFDNRCVRCGDDEKLLTLDHIIPITWPNSSDWISNVQCLCFSCNSHKGNRHATDYRITPFTGIGVIYTHKKKRIRD